MEESCSSLTAAAQGPSGPRGRNSSRASAPDGGTGAHEGNENPPEGPPHPPSTLSRLGHRCPRQVPSGKARPHGAGVGLGTAGGGDGSRGWPLLRSVCHGHAEPCPHLPASALPWTRGDAHPPSPTPDSHVPSDPRTRGRASPSHEAAWYLPKMHAQPPKCFMFYFIIIF